MTKFLKTYYANKTYKSCTNGILQNQISEHTKMNVTLLHALFNVLLHQEFQAKKADLV